MLAHCRDVQEQALIESDLCRFKIRVNTICPGIFPSEMTGAKQTYEQTGMDPGAQKGALRSPLGELARTERDKQIAHQSNRPSRTT